MTLTEKLDMLMKEKGINKAELSRGSGIPYTTIVNFYEKGTENVKLSTLKKLADYFNCSLDYLVDDNITEKEESKQSNTFETIAAHFDGEEFTEEEQEEINNYIQFLLAKRKK